MKYLILIRTFVIGLVILLGACSRPNPITEELESTALNTVQTIIDDMTLPHEAKLSGVPESYDWSSGPRPGMWNTPVDKNGVLFYALTAWGQVYEADGGNPAWNSRVQLRNMQAWVLSKRTNTWSVVQSQMIVEGGAFREDFQGNASKAADIRKESTGISVTAGDGHNFHFWPKGGRAAIDPNDIKGVYITVKARLILNDPNGPDDRSQARYLLGVGADYWLNQTIGWQANPWVNGDVAIARHKFVKPYWESFNMSTLSADELRRNPPPLNVRAINTQ
jgi:hypothetical protein